MLINSSYRFGYNFLVEIHSAIFLMQMDLNPSLRCSIEVKALFMLCNHQSFVHLASLLTPDERSHSDLPLAVELSILILPSIWVKLWEITKILPCCHSSWKFITLKFFQSRVIVNSTRQNQKKNLIHRKFVFALCNLSFAEFSEFNENISIGKNQLLNLFWRNLFRHFF